MRNFTSILGWSWAAFGVLATLHACGDDDDATIGAGGTGGNGAGSGGSAGNGVSDGGEQVGGGAGADGELALGLELVVEGLTSPVDLKPVPDGSGRLVVVDQVGMIHVIDEDGELLAQPFLDLSDRLVELMDDFDERGLLGLGFHPEYADNGRFFVYYSAPVREEAPQDYNHTSHLSEFTVSEDPNVADPDSERILLQVDQPQFNHDAGQIAFGPDGYLYVPLGDGGNADDVGLGHVEDWYEVNEGGNGQDIENNFLGSILRLDIDGDEPYEIPGDNPFVGDDAALDEIWAYGFRNPFKISFDTGGDHELFVADVGQNLYEEVNIVEAGQNYGWNVKEGTHCFSTENPDQELDDCPDTGDRGEPLVDPIVEYANSNQEGGLGLAVIGGHVYRGSALDGFEGRYVFGDFTRSADEPDGSVFVATRSNAESWEMEEVRISGRADGRLGEYVLAFGQDGQGELYLLTSGTRGPTGETGKVYRLIPAD